MKKLIIAPDADFEQDASNPSIYHLQTLNNAIIHTVGEVFSVAGTWRAILASTTADVVTVSSDPAETGVASMVVVGQSQLAHSWIPTDIYNDIPRPTISGGNMYVHSITVAGTPVASVPVTNEALQSKLISIPVAAMSEALNYITPGWEYHVGAYAVPGTSRWSEGNDDDLDRRRSDMESVVSAVEATSGAPVKMYTEFWQGSDSAYAKNMHEYFAPYYFKQFSDGSDFTLGSLNPFGVLTTPKVDRCLFDPTAAVGTKGAGLFVIGETAVNFGGYHTHSAAPSDGLDGLNFSTDSSGNTGTLYVGRANQLNRPAHESYRSLLNHGAGLGIETYWGPPAHSAFMFQHEETMAAGTHPSPFDPEGIVDIQWASLIPLLRQTGLSLPTPTFGTPSISADGFTITIPTNMPAGAVLTTKMLLRGQSMPSTPSPHQQEITGFELQRAGQTYAARRPIYRLDAGAEYPDSHKGTVTIQGSNVQIVLMEPIYAGDFQLYWLDGDSNATLEDDGGFNSGRDPVNRLYRNFALAHFPAWYDSTAMYPYVGMDFDVQQLLTGTSVAVEPVDTGADEFASRAYTADAYFTKSLLPVATAALTLALDFTYRVSAAGGTGELMSMNGGRMSVILDPRSTKGSVTCTFKDSAATSMFTGSMVIPNGTTLPPDVRHRLVLSMSTNSDGANLSRLAAWLNGVEMFNSNGVVGTGVFLDTAITYLLKSGFAGDFYEMAVYGGTHSKGFAGAGGAVTGLTQLHKLSGGASNWNAGVSGLAKSGTGVFS